MIEAAVLAALAELDPEALVAERIRSGRSLFPRILALGKCAVPMASGALAALGAAAPPPSRVLVVAPAPAEDARWSALSGDHPVAGASSFLAGRRLVEFAADAQDEPLLALVSGGGSALAEAARPPASEDDLVALSGALLRAGLPIARMNALRASVSRLKAGGLLRLRRGPVTTLVISDVGEDPAVVASGPTIDLPAPGFPEESFRSLGLSPDVAGRLAAAAARVPDRSSAQSTAEVLASPSRLAALVSERLGADLLAGNLDAAAPAFAARLAEVPAGRVAILVGEPTLPLPADAPPGGRAAHVALDAALRCINSGRPLLELVAIATDGVDGTSGGAGALLGPAEIERLVLRREEAERRLAALDAAGFLRGIGALRPRGAGGNNLRDVYGVAT